MIPPWLEPVRAAAATVTIEQMPPALRPADGNGRRSAVLMLFGDVGDGPAVLLLQRAATLRNHAGQVAFPGGTSDPEDADATATALREAVEEVGLDPSTVEIFGQLPMLHIPISGFLVTPVLGYWRAPHPIGPVDAGEVAQVAVIPVAELIEPAHRFTVAHPSRRAGPGFGVGGLFVWGFTAALLNLTFELAGWTQPWDASVTRAIPQVATIGGAPITPPGDGSVDRPATAQ